MEERYVPERAFYRIDLLSRAESTGKKRDKITQQLIHDATPLSEDFGHPAFRSLLS